MNRISTLEMSTPPSANDSFVPIARGKLVRSKAYARWLQAWLPLGMQDIERLPQHTPAWVRIEAALTRRRDLDNLCKPVCDLLQRLGAVSDDRWIDELSASRSDELPSGTVRVKWGAITTNTSKEGTT